MIHLKPPLQRIKSAFLSAVFFVCLLYGCQTSTYEPDPDALGHRYFPLEVKSFRVYDVTETRYLHDLPTTTTYQVRERVDSVFTDLANQRAYRIVRSRRGNEAQVWVDDSVIVATRSISDLRVSRHNVKVVQMIFPVRNGKSWNPNAFNTAGAASFTYKDVGNPYSYDNKTYEKTATVVQGDVSNLIELDRREEVYAEDIGPVFKNYTRLNYCDNPARCAFNRQPTPYIQEGIRRIDKLIAFGKLP
ncbi:hypothetical protein BH24BAC1_BH24BAC1_01110 [soil metagenome]